MFLMCADTPVMELPSCTIMSYNLLPGILKKDPSQEGYKNWMRKRYSSNSNVNSRTLLGLSYGHGKRRAADIGTRALSLSDAYWLTDSLDVSFEDVSPYYTDFWKTTEQAYISGAIPTLYVDGFKSKEWATALVLKKDSNLFEKASLLLAKEVLSVPVCKVLDYEVGSHTIFLENFTSPTEMFEPESQAGNFDPEDFLFEDVYKIYGYYAIEMYLFDAVVANGDRHTGNFGRLRDTGTGVYSGPSPLFDFDHACESLQYEDIMTREVVSIMRSYPEYLKSCKTILTKIVESSYSWELVRVRAKTIYNNLF